MTRKEITQSVLTDVLHTCDIARTPINWYSAAVDPINEACQIAREHGRSITAQTKEIYKTACTMGHSFSLGIDMAIADVLDLWFRCGWLKGKEIDQYSALSREA